jgi:hypothetical protein
MDGAVVDVASAREWFLEVDAPEHALSAPVQI